MICSSLSFKVVVLGIKRVCRRLTKLYDLQDTHQTGQPKLSKLLLYNCEFDLIRHVQFLIYQGSKTQDDITITSNDHFLIGSSICKPLLRYPISKLFFHHTAKLNEEQYDDIRFEITRLLHNSMKSPLPQDFIGILAKHPTLRVIHDQCPGYGIQHSKVCLVHQNVNLMTYLFQHATQIEEIYMHYNHHITTRMWQVLATMTSLKRLYLHQRCDELMNYTLEKKCDAFCHPTLQLLYIKLYDIGLNDSDSDDDDDENNDDLTEKNDESINQSSLSSSSSSSSSSSLSSSMSAPTKAGRYYLPLDLFPRLTDFYLEYDLRETNDADERLFQQFETSVGMLHHLRSLPHIHLHLIFHDIDHCAANPSEIYWFEEYTLENRPVGSWTAHLTNLARSRPDDPNKLEMYLESAIKNLLLLQTSRPTLYLYEKWIRTESSPPYSFKRVYHLHDDDTKSTDVKHIRCVIVYHENKFTPDQQQQQISQKAKIDESSSSSSTKTKKSQRSKYNWLYELDQFLVSSLGFHLVSY